MVLFLLAFLYTTNSFATDVPTFDYHKSSWTLMFISTIIPSLYKLLKTSLVIASSCAVLALLGVYRYQNKLIYPSGLNNAREKVDSPDSFNLPYQSIDIKTEDGEILKSFLFLHDANSADYTNKTILILGPNAGNIGHYLPVIKFIFEELHYNVFIYSYRGYGKSTGEPSEIGLKRDADAAMKYIDSNKQLANSSIVLYGRSLGGAVANYIAATHSKDISGIILENTFLNIPKVIPHIFPIFSPFGFLCHEIWPSEEYITKIPPTIPVLFLSGTIDEVVPPEHMKKLFELSESNNKVWREFESQHNDTIIAPGYWEIWHDFVRQYINPIGK